jgi:Uma2 family endonuclease
MSSGRAITGAGPKEWTVADLQRRFGPMPLARICQDPPPGTAAEKDVLRLHDHENRLCELSGGVLVEKTVGFEESWLAVTLAALLSQFVSSRNLGIVTGADGMYRISRGLVRIPDVAFVSWDRIPGGKFPSQPIPDLVPDLVAEIISPGNTRKEMEEKRHEYFTRGVRLVWLIRPKARVVDVYTSPQRFTRRTASMALDGGEVLPGFSIAIGDLFRKPSSPRHGKPAPKCKG